jgi:drug/metabolite transporter (DMT)-like permease
MVAEPDRCCRHQLHGFLGRADLLGARAGRWTIPDIDYRGARWFAAVGLCNGLAVLAMYAALEYGPVAVISPLIAGYPLVTLLLSRAFLAKEEGGPQLIAGITGAVCGVVLLLVA